MRLLAPSRNGHDTAMVPWHNETLTVLWLPPGASQNVGLPSLLEVNLTLHVSLNFYVRTMWEDCQTPLDLQILMMIFLRPSNFGAPNLRCPRFCQLQATPSRLECWNGGGLMVDATDLVGGQDF